MSISDITFEITMIFILLFDIWIIADIIVSIINRKKEILNYNNLVDENLQLLSEIALKLKGS